MIFMASSMAAGDPPCPRPVGTRIMSRSITMLVASSAPRATVRTWRTSTCAACATSSPSPRNATSVGRRRGCTCRRRRCHSASASSKPSSGWRCSSDRAAASSSQLPANGCSATRAPFSRRSNASSRRPSNSRLAATDLGLGYCHGSEGGAMRALRRFRDERPDVLVHPASMTSLNIVESIASGRLSVGILRGPIDDVDRVASVPLARVPIDHVAVPLGHRLADADGGRRRRSRARAIARRRSRRRAAGPRRDHRLRQPARSAPGAASRTARRRSSACSTWSRSEAGSAGSTRGRPSARRAAPTSRSVRCSRSGCGTSSGSPGTPATRGPATAACVRVVLETCASRVVRVPRTSDPLRSRCCS